ncbi:hypothetical protein D3C80_1009450 [compost metagenome]
MYIGLAQHLAQVAAKPWFSQHQTKILRALAEAVGAFLQLCGIAHFGAIGNGNVFGQVQQLTAGQLLTEILAGDIRDLMRFIEDHHIGLRDQFGKAALLHHHISQEQMVVHHHHIGIHRTTTRFDHKAIFIQRAIAAQAVVVSAGHQRPNKAVFRHIAATADVALFGHGRPFAQMDQIDQRLPGQLAASHRLLLQTFQTQVIGAPFQQRHLAFVLQCLGHGG